MSTYSIDYISSKVYSKLPPITPKENGIIYSTDDCMESSYKDEYSRKERGQQLMSFKPKNEYEKNKELFNSQSSYCEDFAYSKISKEKSLKPISCYSIPTDTFESTTNYKDDFTAKSVKKLAQKKPIDFDGFSKSHDERMMNNYKEDSIKLDGKQQNEEWVSNYQSEFTKPPLKEYSDGIRQAVASKSLSSIFYDQANVLEVPSIYLSNYQDNFARRKEKMEMVSNFKPKLEFKSPDEVFCSETSYKSEFEKFNVKPSKSFKPLNNYHPTEELLTTRSSYSEDFFLNKRTLKVPSIRPINQITISDEPIDFMTDYSKEFNSSPRGFAIVRPKDFRPIHNIEASSEPFSTSSSYGDDFMEKSRTEKVRPIERKGELKSSTDRMEITTTTKEDFSTKLQ